MWISIQRLTLLLWLPNSPQPSNLEEELWLVFLAAVMIHHCLKDWLPTKTQPP